MIPKFVLEWIDFIPSADKTIIGTSPSGHILIGRVRKDR